MAHLHNTQGHQTEFWHNMGQKLKTGAEIAGAVKGIWNTGKAIYGGVRAIAPLVGALL